MEKIKKRLAQVTNDVLSTPYDPTAEDSVNRLAELKTLQELSKTWKIYEAIGVALPDNTIKERLDHLTGVTLDLKRPTAETSETYIEELKLVQTLIKTWDSYDGVDVQIDGSDEERANRKSNKTWDNERSNFTTSIGLTAKQQEALVLMDCGHYDKVLALGGSGSGKSFVMAYKIVRDTLRHRAPCLIARDKLIDLTQGMIDQIIPTVLQLIAEANGVERWDAWTIDGLRFAKWSEKKSKLEFATGGYIRFAGLSARDLSDSGSDKILSPSWFHVMLEEISELEYETVEKVITRLRYNVDGELNMLLLCENPPSVNHWSYRRFFERKRDDGTTLGQQEFAQMKYILMNPQDNVENLGETYIRNLSTLSGANRERFFEGKFQENESGDIFKRIQWTDNLPRPSDWEKLVIYTDPTPLTGKEHSIWADYKASVLCGLFDGDTYVLDVSLVKGSTEQMLMGIKHLWDASPNQSITEIWMEKKQVPSNFRQVLATFSNLTGWLVPIQMDTRHFGDKKTAIETFLQPLVENDMLYFNESFRDTERGRQAQFQMLKFSRKANKNVHDDIPDAIMKADTLLKGRKARKRAYNPNRQIIGLVTPGFIQKTM